MKSRTARSLYDPPHRLIKLSSPATHRARNDPAASADCESIMICGSVPCESLCPPTSFISSHRPNTGIQAWMRWKEPSQIIKERSSTDSSESGTRPFSAETRHPPRASGEQVRRAYVMRSQSKLADTVCTCVSPCVQWTLYVCCVDAMPANHEQYYGFTKFAVELNELDSSLKLLLPPTDTRLRVDQR